MHSLYGEMCRLPRPPSCRLAGHTKAATGEKDVLNNKSQRLKHCSDNNGGVRALSGANTADNTKMDAATCIQYCYSKGFVYAGTEYSAGADAKRNSKLNTELTASQNAGVITP